MTSTASSANSGPAAPPKSERRPITWPTPCASPRGALGNVWPNPAVGCVIVKDGVIVGRGWTQPGGRPHAEVRALEQAGALAEGATAYVTLEPCAHHGHTPPCAEALIAAKVARVVTASPTPTRASPAKATPCSAPPAST
jgi:pyrimidine deaminase RibD-like protein